VQGRIDAAPVNQDQELVGGLEPVEAARGDGVFARVQALNLEIGGQTEHFGKARRARAANILGGDDENRSRGLRHGFGPTGHRDDLDLRQLLERQFAEIRPRGRLGESVVLRLRGARRNHQAHKRTDTDATPSA
jgi:hypothetical protein